jgi:hypothetical protein
MPPTTQVKHRIAFVAAKAIGVVVVVVGVVVVGGVDDYSLATRLLYDRIHSQESSSNYYFSRTDHCLQYQLQTCV